MTLQEMQSRQRARRSRRRAILITILSLTASGVAVAIDPNESRVIVQFEVALIGFVAVLVAVGVLRRAAPLAPPSPLDRAVRPEIPPPAPLPLDLVRVSRRLAAAEASAADARRQLAPLVAAIAADRMRSHTDIDLDSVYSHLPRPVPDALALVLDPALAHLDTREMPGLDADAVDALVRALEHL